MKSLECYSRGWFQYLFVSFLTELISLLSVNWCKSFHLFVSFLFYFGNMYQIYLLFFYFLRNDNPLKIWKMLFFQLKSFFHFQDIHIFVFLSSPLFFPVRRNLNAYEVINWLNQNLKTFYLVGKSEIGIVK